MTKAGRGLTSLAVATKGNPHIPKHVLVNKKFLLPAAQQLIPTRRRR
jgi:hypothetical protein